jgi:hypothetical protein
MNLKKRFSEWLEKDKRYQVENVDGLNVLVESTNSRRRTEDRRFFVTLIISIISAVAAVIGAVVSILAFIR